MFIASGMLVVPSGQAAYTSDQVAAAREIFRIATTTTVAQRSSMRDRIISLQRRLGLSGADGLIGRQTAKAVSVVHGTPIPGIDITGVAMPTLDPQLGATPAPASTSTPEARTSAVAPQGDDAARRAAQELYDYVMRTSPAQRDRARVGRLQTAIGVDADGRVGPETGNRVFELIGRRIPGTEGDARTSTSTRTIVRSPSVVERSSEGSSEGSSVFSQAQGSLVGSTDDLGSFFERHKVAVIATSAVLVLGGVAAVYFATRED